MLPLPEIFVAVFFTAQAVQLCAQLVHFHTHTGIFYLMMLNDAFFVFLRQNSLRLLLLQRLSNGVRKLIRAGSRLQAAPDAGKGIDHLLRGHSLHDFGDPREVSRASAVKFDAADDPVLQFNLDFSGAGSVRTILICHIHSPFCC